MKAATRQTIAMLAATAVLPLPGNAQRQLSIHPTVFTSSDSSFRISYPSDFQVCTAGEMGPCRLRAYIPPCDEDAIVCVVYPKRQAEGTTFGAAAFQVREIHTRRQAMTADSCVTPPKEKDEVGDFSPWPNFAIPALHPNERINGILFVHGIGGGAAAGHSGSVDLYRAFHRQECYELSITSSATYPANYDPPRKTLAPAAQKDMDESLARILHSFRFQQ